MLITKHWQINTLGWVYMSQIPMLGKIVHMQTENIYRYSQNIRELLTIEIEKRFTSNPLKLRCTQTQHTYYEIWAQFQPFLFKANLTTRLSQLHRPQTFSLIQFCLKQSSILSPKINQSRSIGACSESSIFMTQRCNFRCTSCIISWS